MGNFNRGRSGGGDFRRGGFGGNRGSDRPVVMHNAICGKCGKECEVPFRPTGERPVFCSSCFENNRGSDSGRFERSSDSRELFDAVCADCGVSCKVPFQPSSGKPVYCSNCFGDKKEGGDRGRDQFKELNDKLDKILKILTPDASAQAVQEKITEEIIDQQPEEQIIDTEEKTKVVKKKPSKKKLDII